MGLLLAGLPVLVLPFVVGGVSWQDAFGGGLNDQTHVVSPQAYIQSLVWPAFGAHPQGAKAPGFGSWAFPPLARVTTDHPQK